MNAQRFLFVVGTGLVALWIIRQIIKPRDGLQSHFEEQRQLQRIKTIASAVEQRAEPELAAVGMKSHVAVRTDPVATNGASMLPAKIQMGLKQFDKARSIFDDGKKFTDKVGGFFKGFGKN